MTAVTKHAVTVAGLIAVPAVVATKLIVQAIEGPDHFDPATPPPCWVPIRLHDRHGFAKSGSKATLTLEIANLGHEPETYDVVTSNAAVIVDQPVIVLGALERAKVVLELPVPASTPTGHLPPVIVTVNGCRSYRFRWLVKAKRLHVPVHPHAHLHPHGHWHHVKIDDRPDLQHHWYDHFYSECGCDHD